MYQQINEELSKHRQEAHRLRKIGMMLADLEKEQHALEEKVREAKSVLEKENRDYEKITGKSISSLIFSALGNLDERTEKERREALDAQLQYNRYVDELEDVRDQISKLEAEKLQYAGSQEEYDKLFDEKYRMLMNANDRTAREIMELGKRIEESRANQREIGEAVGVGREARNCLSEALESLSSAEGWGVWDMLGGKFITNLVKHSHIDDASAAAQRAQSLLRRFRTELADVRIYGEIHFDISEFARFADFFFDGLMADWFMQSKIKATQESVRNVLGQVQSVMNTLDDLERAERKIQDDLNERLDNLVIEAQ